MLQFNQFLYASPGPGEVVKSPDSSSRGTRLSSQHPHGVSPLVIVTVPGNRKHTSDLPRHRHEQGA